MGHCGTLWDTVGHFTRLFYSLLLQRHFYAFDNALLLPEYLIEFEYNMSAAPRGDDGGGAAGRGADAALAAVLEPLTAQEGQDMGPLLRPLARFINFGMGATAASNERKEGGEDGGGGEDGVGGTAGSPPRDTPDGVCAVALNMPPHLMPRPKIFSLTEEAVSLYARTPVLTNITYDGEREREREREREMGQEWERWKRSERWRGGERWGETREERTLWLYF